MERRGPSRGKGLRGALVEAMGAGDLGRLTSPRDWLREHLRFSPVGPELEVRAEIREAVHY